MIFLFVDLAGGQHLPWEPAEWLWSSSREVSRDNGYRGNLGLSWAAPAAPTSGASAGLCFAISELPISAFPACMAEAHLFCRASDLFVCKTLGRTCSVVHSPYCYFVSDFPFSLEWTRFTAHRKKPTGSSRKMSASSKMHNICWGGDGRGAVLAKTIGAAGPLRLWYPPYLLWHQNQTSFQNTSKNTGRGKAWWDAKANTTSHEPASACSPQQWLPSLLGSIRGKGTAASYSKFQYFEFFSLVSINSTFLPLCLSRVFADRTELLLANTLFIVIECLVITLYIFFNSQIKTIY